MVSSGKQIRYALQLHDSSDRDLGARETPVGQALSCPEYPGVLAEATSQVAGDLVTVHELRELVHVPERRRENARSIVALHGGLKCRSRSY